jgi:UDP-2,4-diacetamido-2,4,6-trideoxy-beta-L-altropyranose hydrolase
MNVVFRVDASHVIGTGHVMRCLTLADALREQGARCHFVCRAHPGNLLGMIAQRGHAAVALALEPGGAAEGGAGQPVHAAWLGETQEDDARQTLQALRGIAPAWLVVDHYAIDARWERLLRPACTSLMAIDDLADRAHDCDLLLDQNWHGPGAANRYAGLVPARCEQCLGPQYALLKPEFGQLKALMPARDGQVRRVLVFLGGSDASNQTAKVLDALARAPFAHLLVDVVIGVNHPDPHGIAAQVAARAGTSLHQNLPSLAGLMARADLMIGAGGATTWERMSLGLPSIVISLAVNQTPMNDALMEAGYVDFLGEMDDVAPAQIAVALEACLAQPARLKHQSMSMAALSPGTGASAICARLFNFAGHHAATTPD